jgi:hypothetical protein
MVLPAGGDFRRLDGWTPDGKSLLLGRLDPRTNWDLWTLSLDGDHQLQPYLRRPANEIGASVSPDGRWLSYNSDESGRQEGYVQSFPVPGARFQVTTDGTGVYGWKRDGKALGLRPTPDRVVHFVEVLPGPEFRVGPPRPFFQSPDQLEGADSPADWSRILALMPAGKQAKPTIRVVLDWTAMLTKR